MKKCSILAMVLAFTMMLSVVSFAAPAFKVAEDAVPEGVTVTVDADADSIAVTKTAATPGNYYGILLVEGELPTVDDAIYYINQTTAVDTTVAFDVLPIKPEGNKDMTLYLSSNVANDTLVRIPVTYGEEVVTPAGPAVTFMNGAETVATLNAVDGAVVAPAGSANVPTPGADALISKYEFVGWTDADGTVTYKAGDSIPATAEMTLYAKYQMYNTSNKVVKWGDIDGNSLVTAKDVSELIYFYDDPEQCTKYDLIKKKFDKANIKNVYGDVDGNNLVTAKDVSELIYFYDDASQCTTSAKIKTPIYFINK